MGLSAIRAALAAVVLGLAVQPPGASDTHAATLPFPVGPGQGLFLHVSDIHFNPFADPAIVPQLIAAPVEQWQAIFESATNAGFGQYGRDTTYPLLASMLSEAKSLPYDYVLNTGDNLSHGFRTEFLQAGGSEKDFESFIIKTMLFVDRMLKQSFAGAPLISTLGNNDSTCGDYMLAPNSAMLAAVARDLPVVAGHPPALRDFAIGGFYAVPHPTVPNHDIIVLSDVFWSSGYRDACDADGGDPGSAELAWLEWTLFQQKLAGRSASLVMHIPPGIDTFSSLRGTCPASVKSFWQDAYAARFLAVVGAYKDLLRGSYAGHTHMDDFRVAVDAKGAPFLATRITPAVSPIFGNNPTFTVLLYDKTDASVTDYATFYLANFPKIGPAAGPQWAFEYAFGQAYGLKGYDPANLMSLAEAIRGNPSVQGSFMKYYPAETSAQSSINALNVPAYACAHTALTPGEFAACYCPGAAPAPRQ